MLRKRAAFKSVSLNPAGQDITSTLSNSIEISIGVHAELMLTIRHISSMSAPGLADLPTELMQQCMPPDSCSIRAVCQKLFNLQAIGYNSRSLTLKVTFNGATDGGDERARKTLELMKTSFPGLRKLKVGNVDSFIPQCVAVACPQLERLELTHTSCQQQQQEQQEQWQPACLPRLTKLVLECCDIDMEPEAVQQQLQALLSLEDFELMANKSTEYPDRFSCKVTNLNWLDSAKGWLADGPWPHLRILNMYACDFDDADMELLVKKMPGLEELTVNRFLLSQPFVNPPPRLSTVIIFNFVDICWQSLQGLYHLVRSCKRRLTIRTSDNEASCDLSECGLNSTAEEDLAMATSIASVLQQEGVMSCGPRSEYVVSFSITSQEPPHVQQVMHRLLPIFHNPQCLTLQGSIHVSTALLTAVGQLPSLKRFELSDDMTGEGGRCSFEEGMWDGCMVALLSQVTDLSLFCSEATEAHIIRLCSKAPRPIKVRVEPVGWTDGELLSAVLAAAEGRMAELEIA